MNEQADRIAELFERAQNGDRRALEEFHAVFHEALFALCSRQRNMDLYSASDLVQSILLAVTLGIEQRRLEFRSYLQFLKYLSVAVRNRAGRKRERALAARLQARQQSLDGVEPAADEGDFEGLEFAEELLRIREAFRYLSPTQRPIMELHLEGVSLRKIGERLSLPEATVRTRFERACQLLRKKLETPRPFGEGPLGS